MAKPGPPKKIQGRFRRCSTLYANIIDYINVKLNFNFFCETNASNSEPLLNPLKITITFQLAISCFQLKLKLTIELRYLSACNLLAACIPACERIMINDQVIYRKLLTFETYIFGEIFKNQLTFSFFSRF